MHPAFQGHPKPSTLNSQPEKPVTRLKGREKGEAKGQRDEVGRLADEAGRVVFFGGFWGPSGPLRFKV